ncbi:lysoplasmalogenase [Nocardioides hwasunensis]|uniref:Lysoplasmalogenase n=1 Tax=Nocardioides hwasunensis TaxID=397258 RepID=A0ABR8MKJ1_9ACTN|nr:lysoplasmalogenase [Nocardioides hwasunensis]MBD3915029.1 lysoplasmalogenase [Nocardioides hwasunensis]
MVVPRAVSYAVLVVLGLVHLAAQLAAPDGTVASITQPLLMPALATVLLTGTAAPRSLLVRWVLVALFFSWLGDTVPRFVGGDGGFLALVGCFLIAQAAYVVGFWSLRDRSLLARPVLVWPYLVALVVLVLLCRRGAGGLLLPVVVYGVALAAMAILATGLGLLAGIGGAVFMLSDSLIALHAFAGVELPAQAFWVMLTYVVGQTLLVVAVRAQADVAVGKPGLQSTP